MAEETCRECAFPIFEEQLRTMLCDECLALPKSERLSARKEQEAQREIQRQREQNQAAQTYDWADVIRRVRQPRQDRVGDLQAENRELRREVEELRRKLDTKEIEEENVTEVQSFLRNFDNLDLEGEEYE